LRAIGAGGKEKEGLNVGDFFRFNSFFCVVLTSGILKCFYSVGYACCVFADFSMFLIL
jgi:hypothetical protein